MAPGTWALFYAHDEKGLPAFREARVFPDGEGASVWSARGAPMTGGEARKETFSSEDEARARFEALVEQWTADGLRLARREPFDPEVVDFHAMELEMAEGAELALRQLRSDHPDQSFNAFALFSDSDAMTICAAANTRAALAETVAAAGLREEDVLFSCAEWAFEKWSEPLDIAYRRLLAFHRDGVPCRLDGESFRHGVFEAAIRALERLDRQGLFATGPERDELVVRFEVMDHPEIDGAMRRLSSDAVFAKYEAFARALERCVSDR